MCLSERFIERALNKMQSLTFNAIDLGPLDRFIHFEKLNCSLSKEKHLIRCFPHEKFIDNAVSEKSKNSFRQENIFSLSKITMKKKKTVWTSDSTYWRTKTKLTNKDKIEFDQWTQQVHRIERRFVSPNVFLSKLHNKNALYHIFIDLVHQTSIRDVRCLKTNFVSSMNKRIFSFPQYSLHSHVEFSISGSRSNIGLVSSSNRIEWKRKSVSCQSLTVVQLTRSLLISFQENRCKTFDRSTNLSQFQGQITSSNRFSSNTDRVLPSMLKRLNVV